MVHNMACNRYSYIYILLGRKNKMQYRKIKLKGKRENLSEEELLIQMIKESELVVKHYQTDLIYDIKRILKESHDQVSFTLYWITRKCGTHIFDSKFYTLGEILKMLNDNYAEYNVYKIVKDIYQYYSIEYIIKEKEEDKIK